MNRKVMLYQIKERQIRFLLEDILKSIEEYKKNNRNKRQWQKQKSSYQKLTEEDKQLKLYTGVIKQQQQQQQQQQYWQTHWAEKQRQQGYPKLEKY